MRVTYGEIIHSANLYGFGGQCGIVAFAINDVIFDGRGTLVVATNPHINRHLGRPFIGHVGVLYRGRIYDAEGRKDYEDFRAWGMVDPQDPDYWEDPDDPSTVWLTDDQAYDAEVTPLDAFGDPIEIVRAFTHEAAWTGQIAACPTYATALKELRRARHAIDV